MHKNRLLLTISLCIAMVLSFQVQAHAADDELPDIVVVETPSEYAENIPEAEDNSAKSIILSIEEPDLRETYGASSIVYNAIIGVYMLGYDTNREGREAYGKLCQEYGEENVMYDIPVVALEDDSDISVGGAAVVSNQYQTRTDYTDSDSVSWGIDYMHLDEARDAFNSLGTDSTVKVAILDTGINRDNAMFEGRTISEESDSFVTTENSEYSYYDDTTENGGKYGHGTHVAGIIADGTANDVELMIIKMLSSSGSATITTLCTAMEYAVSNGADVINLSLGVNMTSINDATKRQKYIDMMDAQLLNAYNNGVAVVVAASNDKSNTEDKLVYPACSEYAEAVSGLKYVNGDVAFDSSYSNYGSCIAYAAPGTTIYSAFVGNTAKYQSLSGTSMATPHIAAAFAMAALGLKENGSDVTVDSMRDAVDAYVVDKGDEGRDIYYGKGAVSFSYNENDFTYSSDGTVVTGLSDSGIAKAKSYPVLAIPEKSPSDVVVVAVGDAAFGGVNIRKFLVPESVVIAGENAFGQDNHEVVLVVESEEQRMLAEGENVRIVMADEPEVTEVVPAVTLARTTYTYSGKANKPDVTVTVDGETLDSSRYTVTYESTSWKVGTHYVTVELKGNYSGSAQAAYKVIPKATSIRSLGIRSKSVIVKWYKRTAQTSGYQIRYSRYSSMKSYKTVTISGGSTSGTSTVSKRINKLKSGRRYYFKVRTYKTVNGVRYYSNWSKVKSARAK